MRGDDEDDADEMIVDVGDAETSYRRLHNNLSIIEYIYLFFFAASGVGVS